MGFNEDLIKASNAFQQNVQSLTLSRSINSANEAAEQVKDSELDEQEQRKELKNIAQGLTVHLAGAGIAPQRALAASEAIAPPKRFFQTADQVLLNPEEADKQQQAMGTALKIQEQSAKLEMFQAKQQAKLQGDQGKFLSGVGVEFGTKVPAVKKIQEGLSFAGQADALLAQNDFASLQTMVQRGVLKLLGEGSRLSDQDIIQTAPGRSLGLRTKSALWSSMANAITKENKNELRQIIATLKAASINSIRRKGKFFVKAKLAQARKSGFDISESELIEQVAGFSPDVAGMGGSSISGGFDPESKDYDQATAKRFGLKRDSTGHMSSAVPLSKSEAQQQGVPEGSSLILKGRGHETFQKEVEASERIGRKVIRGSSGRYYSVPEGSNQGQGFGGQGGQPNIPGLRF